LQRHLQHKCRRAIEKRERQKAMVKIKLNGANPDTVAEKVEGTIIMINGDILTLAGADITKVQQLQLELA